MADNTGTIAMVVAAGVLGLVLWKVLKDRQQAPPPPIIYTAPAEGDSTLEYVEAATTGLSALTKLIGSF